MRALRLIILVNKFGEEQWSNWGAIIYLVAECIWFDAQLASGWQGNNLHFKWSCSWLSGWAVLAYKLWFSGFYLLLVLVLACSLLFWTYNGFFIFFSSSAVLCRCGGSVEVLAVTRRRRFFLELSCGFGLPVVGCGLGLVFIGCGLGFLSTS